MSRIGKRPIVLPSGVTATVDGRTVQVTGPKGTLSQLLPVGVQVAQTDGQLTVSVANPENTQERAFWGLSQKLIANMVEGVTKGFEKKLVVSGVGYKVALQGSALVLHLGFSHPVNFPLPAGITASVDGLEITLTGTDRQLVGQVAANIRKLRKPEPYKGKGITYAGEVIRRKAGKAAKAGA